MGTQEMVSLYAEAFLAGTEPAGIRARLDRCATPTVTVIHPAAGVLQGIDAVAAFAEGFHRQNPGASVVATTDVDEHHGRARFAWAIEGGDGARVAEGIDFVEIADDGRIQSIVIFPGLLPDASKNPNG